MKLRDFYTDPKSGKFSHTRLWSNIGMLTLTLAFWKMAVACTVTAEIMFAYGAIVVSHRLGDQYLKQYRQQPMEREPAIGFTANVEQDGDAEG